MVYRELGREKVREMPDNAQAHFELGLLEFDNFHDFAAARSCFVRTCEMNPLLSVAWLFLGLAWSRLKRYDEALAALQRCERLGYAAPLLAETKGDIFYNTEKFREASRCYERALRKSAGNAILESKLGLSLIRGGRKDKGILLLRAAPAKQPELAELYDRLIQAHVWLSDLAEAASAAERKLDKCQLLTPTDFLRASKHPRADRRNGASHSSRPAGPQPHLPQFPRLLAVLAELEVSQNERLPHLLCFPLLEMRDGKLMPYSCMPIVRLQDKEFRSRSSAKHFPD